MGKEGDEEEAHGCCTLRMAAGRAKAGWTKVKGRGHSARSQNDCWSLGLCSWDLASGPWT